MFLKIFLTGRIEYESVVKNIVDQEVVGGDAKFSTVVVIIAVSCDDGV